MTLRNDNPDNIIIKSERTDIQFQKEFGNYYFKLGQYKTAIMAYEYCLVELEKLDCKPDKNSMIGDSKEPPKLSEEEKI